MAGGRMDADAFAAMERENARKEHLAWVESLGPRDELRVELASLGGTMGFHALRRMMDEYQRKNKWIWMGLTEKSQPATTEGKLAMLRIQKIKRIKAEVNRAQVRVNLIRTDARRCAWKGFTKRGQPAVCSNHVAEHRLTKLPMTVCGFHTTNCVLNPPAKMRRAGARGCKDITRAHANAEGLCLTHYKADNKGREPPIHKPFRIPGVLSSAAFEAKLQRIIDMVDDPVSHALAPYDPPPSSSEESSSDDSESSSDDDGGGARFRLRNPLAGAANRVADRFERWTYKKRQPYIERRDGSSAATLIQSMWRRRLAKRVAKGKKGDSRTLVRADAVLLIQRRYRGMVDKRFVEHRRATYNAAARLVQRHFTQWRRRNAMYDAVRRSRASKRIGRFARAALWRLRQRLMLKRMRVKINMRVEAAEREVMKAQAVHRKALRRAATRVQAIRRGAWDRRYARNKRRVLTWATNAISHWYTGCVDRVVQVARLNQARHNMTRINSHARVWLAKRTVIRKIIEDNAAATKIQAFARGNWGRARARKRAEWYERNWRFFNPERPREAFAPLLPKATYGQGKPIRISSVQEVRKGSFFRTLTTAVSEDEALMMQFYWEGIAWGADKLREEREEAAEKRRAYDALVAKVNRIHAEEKARRDARAVPTRAHEQNPRRKSLFDLAAGAVEAMRTLRATAGVFGRELYDPDVPRDKQHRRLLSARRASIATPQKSEVTRRLGDRGYSVRNLARDAVRAAIGRGAEPMGIPGTDTASQRPQSATQQSIFPGLTRHGPKPTSAGSARQPRYRGDPDAGPVPTRMGALLKRRNSDPGAAFGSTNSPSTMRLMATRTPCSGCCSRRGRCRGSRAT